MRSNLSSFALATFTLFARNSSAFQPTTRALRRNHGGSALASTLSYLDGLNGAAPASSSSYAPPGGAAPNGPIYSTPSVNAAADAPSRASLSHASLDYFDVANMASKGPRTTADWGAPQDGTRKLADDGTFRVGAWYCTEGGWPSASPKAHTEIFYMLDGHGCLGDADGTKHYFGPGDTVIIPKGHQGRWDVYSPIHKLWAVSDHDRIEETSNPIRVSVEHYHTFAPEYMDVARADSSERPLYGEADPGATRTFYEAGPTSVGVWTCGGGESFPVAAVGGRRSFFHLLEGVLFVTDGVDGSARRCVAGDTVMLPAGFTGHIDVIENSKKLWTNGS